MTMPPKKKSNTANLDAATDRHPSVAATLPAELLLDIMDDAANPTEGHKGKINYRTRTLCMLSRVNKRWYATSKVPLYRRLSFNNKPDQIAKLRRTLVKSPELAAMVVELSIHVVGDHGLPTAPAAYRKAVARRQRAGKDFWDVLETLTHLESLKMWRFADLPTSYIKKLQDGTRFKNLSTVKRWERPTCPTIVLIHYRFEASCTSQPITVALIQNMTALETYCLSTMPSHNVNLTPTVFAIRGPLTVLSYSFQHRAYGSTFKSANTWDDLLALMKCSKDTLRTLELDNVDDIPTATLAAGLAFVGPSLHRFFYGSRASDSEAVVAAVLPACRSLVSLRTSLSPLSSHKLLEVLPPTIIELGMANLCRDYGTVGNEYGIFSAVLNNARRLPRLKVLWLLHQWNGPEFDRCEEMREEMVSKGVEWRLLFNSYVLPRYGSDGEA